MPKRSTRRRFMATAAASLASASGAAWIGFPQSKAQDPPRRAPWIIDSHVHLKHGDTARTEYSPETIVATMDEVGIDRSVVFAICTTTQQSIKMAQSAVQKYPDRLIPYVYALPHYERPVVQEIDEALAGNFRGVKIHAGECTLAEYVVDPVLEVAGKHGAPCLVDCLGNLPAARRMAEAFPETKLIVAHMGRFLCQDAKLLDQFITLAENCPNVLLDLSGVVIPEKIEEAVKRVGAGRLAWGTDGPDKKPDTVTYARDELEKIRRLGISDADKAAILGGTIRDLLGL